MIYYVIVDWWVPYDYNIVGYLRDSRFIRYLCVLYISDITLFSRKFAFIFYLGIGWVYSKKFDPVDFLKTSQLLST